MEILRPPAGSNVAIKDTFCLVSKAGDYHQFHFEAILRAWVSAPCRKNEASQLMDEEKIRARMTTRVPTDATPCKM